MDKHTISDIMGVTMEKIREMVDVNTIVGEPIKTEDGVILIPVSKVSFGFTSGGSDFTTKNQPANTKNFGGGAGAGVQITPVAFIVVQGESVKILNVAPPVTTTVDRVVEKVPEVMDRVTDFLRERKEEKESKQQ